MIPTMPRTSHDQKKVESSSKTISKAKEADDENTQYEKDLKHKFRDNRITHERCHALHILKDDIELSEFLLWRLPTFYYSATAVVVSRNEGDQNQTNVHLEN
jgi:hypothetical protein